MSCFPAIRALSVGGLLQVAIGCVTPTQVVIEIDIDSDLQNEVANLGEAVSLVIRSQGALADIEETAEVSITDFPVQKFLIPLGGVLLGSGLMTMLFGWGIGEPGLDSAQQISSVGYVALDEIVMTSYGPIAFGLIFLGAALAIAGNATAWKETGGY